MEKKRAFQHPCKGAAFSCSPIGLFRRIQNFLMVFQDHTSTLCKTFPFFGLAPWVATSNSQVDGNRLKAKSELQLGWADRGKSRTKNPHSAQEEEEVKVVATIQFREVFLPN